MLTITIPLGHCDMGHFVVHPASWEPFCLRPSAEGLDVTLHYDAGYAHVGRDQDMHQIWRMGHYMPLVTMQGLSPVRALPPSRGHPDGGVRRHQ